MKTTRFLSVGFVMILLFVISGCGDKSEVEVYNKEGGKFSCVDTVVSSAPQVFYIPVYKSNSSDLSPLEYDENYYVQIENNQYPESEIDMSWIKADYIDMNGNSFVRVELMENTNPSVRRQAIISLGGFRYNPSFCNVMIEQWPSADPESHITLKYGDKVMESDVRLNISDNNEYSNPEIPALMSRLAGNSSVDYIIENDTIRIVDENDPEGMALVQRLVKNYYTDGGQHNSGEHVKLTTTNIFFNDNYDKGLMGILDLYLCHQGECTSLNLYSLPKISSLTLDYKWDNDKMCAVLSFLDIPYKYGGSIYDPIIEEHTLNFIVTKKNPHISWSTLRSIPYMGTGKSWGTQIKSLKYYTTEYK